MADFKERGREHHDRLSELAAYLRGELRATFEALDAGQPRGGVGRDPAPVRAVRDRPSGRVERAHRDGRKHHPISWREVRHRFTQGGRYAHNGVTFYGAASVKIERYRYRGSKIPNPWTITDPITP
jgi:hypothetical protein